MIMNCWPGMVIDTDGVPGAVGGSIGKCSKEQVRTIKVARKQWILFFLTLTMSSDDYVYMRAMDSVYKYKNQVVVNCLPREVFPAS